MALRLTLGRDNKSIGDKFRTRMKLRERAVTIAAKRTMEEAGEIITRQARADILGSGNFSARWPNSLRVVIDKTRGPLNYVLRITSTIKYFFIHEFGGIIKGKPLLWIPLPWNRQKVRAREFSGKLFRVDRKGKNPLLMTPRGKGEAEAMYVGVKQVRLKRRFHLRDIVRNTARRLPALFRKNLRAQMPRR